MGSSALAPTISNVHSLSAVNPLKIVAATKRGTYDTVKERKKRGERKGGRGCKGQITFVFKRHFAKNRKEAKQSEAESKPVARSDHL